jgi:BirA family biotin operon repressor/biotin-[acetyl-CoA-carboxylase] ligase
VQHRIIRLAETQSTNQDALRLALAGEALPVWISAERQTGGKGRAGRGWTSIDGNLQASCAIQSAAPIAQAGELALVAGVAAIDAIRDCAPGVAARLKWPNDILIGGAKAGGILVESSLARPDPGFIAVIGYGLNVAAHPDDLGRAATSLAAHGATVTADAMLAALASRLQHWLTAWDDGRNFERSIAAAWQSRAGADGESISVTTPSGSLPGRYRGIDARGYLLLDADDGTRHTVTYGDVALLGGAGESGAR